MAESPVNGVGTTLASSITNSATSVSLTSATGFTNAQYHCLISDGTNYEIVLATALSGTTLTITRAVESYNGVQTALAFASGSTINVVPSVASVVGLIEGQPYLTVTGVGGATTATRYVGGTSQGPPATGTFTKGDWIVDLTGTIWVCTVSGTVGSWVPTIGSSLVTKSASYSAAAGDFVIFTGSTTGQTITLPTVTQNGLVFQIKNLATVPVSIQAPTTTPVTTALSISGTQYVGGVATFSVPANTAYTFAYSPSAVSPNVWYCFVTTDLGQMGGTLPAARGGTGTTTSTGTGSVVLNYQPSILGPSITVPTMTSPTITNAAGSTYPGNASFATGSGGVVSVIAPTGQAVTTTLTLPLITTSPDTLVALAAAQTLTNKTLTTPVITGPYESVGISATALSGSVAASIAIATDAVYYYTANPTATWALNITNAPTTTGQSATVAILVNNGATAYLPSNITVNGTQASQTASITAIAGNTTQVTYTASNSYVAGQQVTVTGATTGTFNGTFTVVSATSSQFVVANTAVGASSTASAVSLPTQAQTTNSITSYYQSGTAWASADASTLDVYTITVICTGSSAWTLLLGLTKF